MSENLAIVSANVDVRDWYDLRFDFGAYNERVRACTTEAGERSFIDRERIASRIADELVGALPGLRELISDLSSRGEGIEAETGRTYGPSLWSDDDLTDAVAEYFSLPNDDRREVNPFELALNPDDSIDWDLHEAWRRLDAMLTRYAHMLANLEAHRMQSERELIGEPLENVAKKAIEEEEKRPYGLPSEIQKWIVEELDEEVRSGKTVSDAGKAVSRRLETEKGIKRTASAVLRYYYR